MDPLTWEIALKDGVLFQDQSPLDADAVKWSIERIIDEKSAVFNKRIQGLPDIGGIFGAVVYRFIAEERK